MSETTKRGGARAGAGRKSIGAEPLASISLRMRQSDVYLLEDAGNGNISAGLRALIDELLVFRASKGAATSYVSTPTTVKKNVVAAPRPDRIR